MDTELRDQPPTASNDPGEPVRVLLVANSRVYQTLLNRLLERSGHRVVTVPNGAEAVGAFCSQSFELIVTEVQMPVMTGPEAAAAIRGLEQVIGGHIPIIAVSADPDQCPRTNIDACVPKPVSAAALLQAMAEVGRNRRPAGESSAPMSSEVQSASSASETLRDSMMAPVTENPPLKDSSNMASVRERFQRFVNHVDYLEDSSRIYTIFLRALCGHYDGPGGAAKAEADAGRAVNGDKQLMFLEFMNHRMKEPEDKEIPTFGHAVLYATRLFTKEIDRPVLVEAYKKHEAGVFYQGETEPEGLYPSDPVVIRLLDSLLFSARRMDRMWIGFRRRRGRCFLEAHFVMPGRPDKRRVIRIPTIPRAYDSIFLRLKQYCAITAEEPLHVGTLTGTCEWDRDGKPMRMRARIFGHADRVGEDRQHETAWLKFEFPQGRPDMGPWIPG